MKKSEKSTVSKILRLPDEMNDRLKAMADDRGISQNEFIIKAIDAYLESKNNDDTIPSIGLDTTPKIGLDTMDSIIELIAPRFLALESKIEGLEQQLKTIAPGEGTIAEQILKLMGDGNEWLIKDLLTRFPGVQRGSVSGKVTDLKNNGSLVLIKRGVYRIANTPEALTPKERE